MEPVIIDHTHNSYINRWRNAGANKYNGAYYYSREIVRNIIPRVETDRNWVTVNIYKVACNHAIVFVHNNLHPENYAWLKDYSDLILVCGVPETVDKVKHLGRAIYLPLSVDVADVEQYRATEKTRGAAFAGRPSKATMPGIDLPSNVEQLQEMPRPELLRRMAEYYQIFAVGRTAIEAKILGCEILPYDPRFPDPSIWQVIDNKDAAVMLQSELDKIEPRPERKVTRDMNEWQTGFPERNGIYKCRVDGKDIRPLMHKKCSINGRHRWMELTGHDVLGSVEWRGERLSIEEL
jgi:hypothetical protein